MGGGEDGGGWRCGGEGGRIEKRRRSLEGIQEEETESCGITG